MIATIATIAAVLFFSAQLGISRRQTINAHAASTIMLWRPCSVCSSVSDDNWHAGTSGCAIVLGVTLAPLALTRFDGERE